MGCSELIGRDLSSVGNAGAAAGLVERVQVISRHRVRGKAGLMSSTARAVGELIAARRAQAVCGADAVAGKLVAAMRSSKLASSMRPA